MTHKAPAQDFTGRFREIVSDPLNLLIARVPDAGIVTDDLVVLHNGHRVPLRGAGSYYSDFSDIFIINRGVHEPLEEFVFQQVLTALPADPVMIELGAYWGHYSMWLKQQRPDARVHLVEPEAENLAAGRANFERHGYAGTFVQAFVGPDDFTLDSYLAQNGLDRLSILHSDIQGYETAMLDGATQALARRAVDYWFISTHSQTLHQEVQGRLAAAGYRVEVSADFDNDTTSFDGFVLAVHPALARLMRGPDALGRSALATASPRMVLDQTRRLLRMIDETAD